MQQPQLQQTLELYFRAEGLADKDTLSKSDPRLALYEKTPGGAPRLVGRTETVKNDLSPTFETSITVSYLFEQRQDFHVKLEDVDDSGAEVLGHADFTLAQVVGSRASTREVKLSTQGKLFITAKERSRAGRDTVRLQFRGLGLKNMDFMGKSDPYFKLLFKQPNGGTKEVYTSEVRDDTLDPEWKPFAVHVASLTTADMEDATIRFACYDKDLTSDDAMGSFDVSFARLMAAPQDRDCFFELKGPKGNGFGRIACTVCAVDHKPTFLELLSSGLGLSLAVSVDFTASNRDPNDQASLHYHRNPHRPNQYEQAITGVASVLMPYDADQQIPAFGFGAVIPPTHETKHFFHLNMQPSPYVTGLPQLLAAYKTSLETVRLSGPTNFAPTLEAIASVAREAAGQYTILLILTDGEITDMAATVRALVQCNDLPLSVIIVGVGSNCDFEMMAELDGDGGRLAHNGVAMTRDIVQFVPYRDFVRKGPEALAAAVLQEVPGQVEAWAELSGFGKRR